MKKESINTKIKKEIKSLGGKQLDGGNNLITHYGFSSAQASLSAYHKMMEDFPGADFFLRDRRLCVYGVND